ncbi:MULTISPECIES: hypothetical protein [unclassified Archaeoglobus]|jgi:hypothetical protein|uniref:hypothetical protein n=1 Tax=unclassified Archaeoglobus TaxID=2643606 RepID=UPI0025BB726E|nr:MULTISPECIES: hypothetical protein [unclassified Archaeoglobus]
MLWLRHIEVRVGSLLFTSNELDIEFEVEKKEGEPKTATIIVYNISQQTREQIKTDIDVELKAGYNDDYGTIFYGKVASVDVARKRGDEATIIECTDSSIDLNKEPVVVKYPAGTDASRVIQDMCSACGIAIGKIENTGVTFEKPFVFQGTPKEVIDEVVKLINGKLRTRKQWDGWMMSSMPKFGEEYVFTIENNMAFLTKDRLSNEAEVLESETGLLEVSKIKDDQDKFRIRALLRWKIQVGSVVVVNSEKLSGQFVVSSYKHVCKGGEYYTEVEVIP